MIYWSQLLHFYQPPTQLPAVLDKICHESYRPLISVLRRYPSVRVTININGVLTEMLRDYGHSDIIQGLKGLAERGQVELVGSGKYHPILPLVPPAEMRRQVELNQKTNRFFFGDVYEPAGFFPPEMAYSRDILPAIIETGHRWLIVSGVACPGCWTMNSIHRVEHEGKQLAVLFRDDVLSNKVSFKDLGPADFLAHLNSLDGDRGHRYVVTAMDAETYGHHIQNWESLFLAEVYEQLEVRRETYAGIKQRTALADQESRILARRTTRQRVQTATISQLLDLFPAGNIIDPKPSSWSTSGQDLAAGNPFPLWHDKDSEIHRLQWEHLRIAIEVAHKAQETADNDESKFFAGIARGLLDRALHSCQFWWASRRPMWDINIIHMGLIDQWRVVVNAYRAINVSRAPGDVKRDYYYKVTASRDVRNKIVDRLF